MRFLSNRSSGKMGFALANRARARGAEVVLVSPSGPAQRTRLSVLLPQAFRPRDLEAFAAQSEGKPPSWTGTRRT